MKTLQELLQKKEEFYTKMLETSEKYYNFDKPIRPNREQMEQYAKLMKEGNEQQATKYYTSIKRITEKNRLEKKELKKQRDIYKLAYEMIDINIMIAFETLHKKKFLNVLNKYVKKRIGEKTKKKIEEELKALDKNIKRCYLSINSGLVGNNNIEFIYSDYYIEITLNKDVPGTWLNENGEEIKDIYNYYTYNYKYIDNILQLATEKIKEKEKIEEEAGKEIKAIREKIRNFNNNFYCKNEKEFKIDEYSIFR